MGGTQELPEIVGTCWAVEQPGQNLPPEASALPLELLLPPLINLDAAPANPSDTVWRRVVELPGSLPSIHGTAQWRQLASDSVEIAWSTGFSGWILRVGLVGDTLRGEAEEIYDAGDGSLVPARATRFPCEAPIPLEHRRRYGRGPYVELEDGTMLEVGQPFDSAATSFDRLDRRQYRARQNTADVFAGSDSVLVHVDRRGLISGIRVVYSGTSAIGRISQHLWTSYGTPSLESYGPGTSVTAKRRRDVSWYNREIYAELRTHPDGGGMVLRLANPKGM